MLQRQPQQTTDRLWTPDAIELRDLYRQALPVAIRYVLWLCHKHHYDGNAAEDIVQEALMIVWRERQRISSKEAFRPILFQTITNLFKNHRRQLRRNERMRGELTLEQSETASIIDPRGITTMEIHEALAQLGRKEREALELSLIGLTIDELSLLQHCSESAMKKRLERARQTVRRYLSGDEDAPMPVILGADLSEEMDRLLNEAIVRIPDLQTKTERRGRKPKRRDTEE